MIKTNLWIDPVLAEAESLLVQSNLPRAGKGLDFFCVNKGVEKKQGQK